MVKKRRKLKRPTKAANVLEKIRAHVAGGSYRDTRHATERKVERNISLLEILHVFQVGRHEKRKDEFKPEHDDWNYAVNGKTVDGRRLRVAVALPSRAHAHHYRY